MDVVITVIAVILVVLVWIMLYDSNRFVVRHYFLRDQRIKKPVKAVVLADLHNKRYGKENERLLQAIDEIRPDMILIAGDILTAKPKASLETAVDLLTKLAGKYPIYYGNGNHEHRLKLYPENYGDMAERYEEALQKIGIRRLVNEHTVLEESGICIYGSEIDKLYYQALRDPAHGSGVSEKSVGTTFRRKVYDPDRPQSGLFSEIRGLGSRSGAGRPCPRRYGESPHLGKRRGVSQCETFSKI